MVLKLGISIAVNVLGKIAISNNINIENQYKGPGPPQFKFLPTKLNVQAERNSEGLFLKVQSQALI